MIINAEAKSISYGYSIGEDYSQIDSFGIIENGLFVSEITGKINNSQTVKYFGFIQRRTIIKKLVQTLKMIHKDGYNKKFDLLVSKRFNSSIHN